MGDNSTPGLKNSGQPGRVPREYPPRENAPQSYALSGKIMLSAIVILFTVVLLVICLHLYARWYLIRARRRHGNLRRRNRRTHLVFSTTPPSNTVRSGLEPSVLKSLPTFVFSTSTTHEEVLECAVCLSEFEENEKGRRLPKCNHSFHIDCIDMWFHSHSTCPLCRSSVNPEDVDSVTENQVEIVIDSGELEPGTSSELCPSCRHGEDEMGRASSSNSNSNSNSNSVGFRRNMSIEVPRRNESFKGLEEEIQGFKSPGSRILALKRILSRASTPSMSCSSGLGFDLERGEEEAAETTTPSNHQEGRTRVMLVSPS